MAIVTISQTTARPLIGAITRQFVMAEASQCGRWCYIDSNDQLNETAADEAATSEGTLAFIVSGAKQNTAGTVEAGETVTAVVFGPVAMPGAALDPTSDYYLANTTSTVNGLMADAAGTVTRRTGRALASEVFFVNPDIAVATSA